ncbi:GntR family transcriptional regulator [Oceaniglobus trochenteri]|uniref:GntR family transcriptional regulator n=1 Tax=Oceaniglobus trochenteri TaxID=2763260 RepID=UPI001CFF76C3|nr:GntR family transcriptional regulator [Oceaniglobus trochenteri]
MSDPKAPPLYLQIADALLHDIAAGRLVEGERLRPEREMASDFGISVGTLRKALADLTAKGHLERRQGSGNYVRETRNAGGIYAFFRLELVTGGGQPSATVLSVDLMDKPEDAPGFGMSQRAHRIRRLRLLGGVPAVIEEIWLDHAWARTLSQDDLEGSLYHHYRSRLGLMISRVEDRIGVAAMPNWGGLLPPGSACGFIERLSWDQNGVPAEYSRNWFDPGVARYVSRI